MTDKQRAPLPVSKAETAYDLLDEICAVITEEPLRYNQESWFLGDDKDEEIAYVTTALRPPSCGTVACIAGWTVALRESRDALKKAFIGDRYWNVPAIAREILGINTHQAAKLFDGNALEAAQHYGDQMIDPQTSAYALIGEAHIRAFMRAHEIQLKAHRLPPPGTVGIIPRPSNNAPHD